MSEPINIIVSIRELLAALLFVSNDESRYVLNGVMIEAKPKCPPLLVATDGRRMCVIESAAAQDGDVSEPVQFILHHDFIKGVHALVKMHSIKLFPLVAFEVKAGSKRVVVHFIGGHSVLDCAEGALIEGTYPKWKEVIPTGDKEPVSQLGLNAEYLGDFSKAAKILEVDVPVIQMNLFREGGAIEVRMANKPNFYGVIMPCKIIEAMDHQPEFLGLTAKAA